MSFNLALLGNNRAISIAELAAVLPGFKPKQSEGQILFFETGEALDQAFLDRLGGTILISKEVGTIQGLNEIPDVLLRELASAKGKVSFGFRFFGVDLRKGRELFKKTKKILRSKNIPSRYIGSEREPAKPIQLHDSGMLDPKKGAELVIVKQDKKFWVGRTIAAQDVKKYTLRDVEKPVRDTTVGLLPPKLAQVLLNFGEFLCKRNSKSEIRNPKTIVFDPFCGTGVIPLEAMLRGHDVLASDISEKAVNGCKKNIEWMRETFEILKKDVETTVWKQDARKPFEIENKPTMIVTEGTLGLPLKSRPTLKQAEKFAKESDSLVSDFLKNCKATLPGVPIVMTLPVWYARKRMVWLQKFFEEIGRSGYRAVLPPHTDPANPPRMSLLYRRPDQFVGREIVLLKPGR